jgi:hypothetical protein
VLVEGATALGQPLPKCCTFHQMIPYPRSVLVGNALMPADFI